MSKKLTQLAAFILITILPLQALCACGGAVVSPETPPIDITIPLTENGAAAYTVIRADEGQDFAVSAATALRKALTTESGIEFTIKSDFLMPGTAPDASAKEILVGETNRAEASAPAGVGAWSITVSGSRIILAGRSAGALADAMEAFMNQITKTEDGSLAVTLPEAGLTGSAEEILPLTEGADIRIMSYNILAEMWNDKLPIPGRDTVVADTMLSWLPDVIGLQEVSENWYKALAPMVGDTYAFVNEQNDKGEQNYSGMAYHTGKVKLIADGCERFSQGNSSKLRLMNWGLFERIDGGERFIVISTHWDINTADEPKNRLRLIQAGEMAERVKELAKEYDCPVIATGDYNAGRDTEEFRLYEKDAGTKDAQKDAEVRENDAYRTAHKMGTIPVIGIGSIDHITYTEGVTGLYFKNFISQPYLEASDHSPILCDFRFD